MSKNYKNSNCQYAEQIIAYLYGEIDAKENAFCQTHLAGCPHCAAELQSFSMIRSSIGDWKTNEFDVLPTPFIALPNVETKPISPFEKIRALFAFNWATATAAFVFLALCGGLTFIIFNQNIKTDLADLNNINTVAAPSVEQPPIAPQVVPNNGKTSIAETPTAKMNAPENERPAKVVERKSATPAPKIKIADENRAALRPAKNDAPSNKTVVAAKQKSPRLIVQEDEEENGVRLTDLFAEIDTK